MGEHRKDSAASEGLAADALPQDLRHVQRRALESFGGHVARHLHRVVGQKQRRKLQKIFKKIFPLCEILQIL